MSVDVLTDAELGRVLHALDQIILAHSNRVIADYAVKNSNDMLTDVMNNVNFVQAVLTTMEPERIGGLLNGMAACEMSSAMAAALASLAQFPLHELPPKPPLDLVLIAALWSVAATQIHVDDQDEARKRALAWTKTAFTALRDARGRLREMRT